MLIHARIMHQLKGCKEDFFTNEDILKEQVDFINKHLAEASHKWIPNNNDFLVFLFESTDIICIIEDSTVYKSGNISITICNNPSYQIRILIGSIVPEEKLSERAHQQKYLTISKKNVNKPGIIP